MQVLNRTQELWGDMTNETEDTKYIRGYMRAWAALVTTVAFALGVGLIVVGTIHGPSKSLQNILQAVGASVIASVILYVLVSLFIDPRRQAVQAREAVMFGVQAANRQFTERFEVALPTAVYEGSKFPKLTFRNAFAELLSSSTRYDFKGDSANFTTYRLARCCNLPEIRRLDQIRLCILDPLSENAINVYAEQYLRQDGREYGAARITEMRKLIKDDIYVSLWILYQLRHGLTTSIFFHADLPFFRCELFDTGMFLTYYLDRRTYPDYPETLQFSASTRPYRAYSSAMAVSRTFAPKKVVFGSGPDAELISNDGKIKALLELLGCQLGPNDLDDLQRQRFDKFDKWLEEAGLNSSKLF